MRKIIPTLILLLTAYSGIKASGGTSGALVYSAHVLALVIGFLVPALMSSPVLLSRRWKYLAVTSLLSCLLWDVMTGVFGSGRSLFAEWYLVYTSGPLFFLLLLYVNSGFVSLWEYVAVTRKNV